MFQNVSKLAFVIISLSTAALLSSCDGSYGITNQPPSVDADDSGDQLTAVISNVVNYGISDDGTGTNTNQVHLELDGTFSPDSDNIVGVTCGGVTLDPSVVTMTSQSDSQILLMIPTPSSDTNCTFAAMSTNFAEGDFGLLAISSTQNALSIASATSSHGQVVLNGTFASTGNSVAVSCDGSQLDPSTVTVTLDSASTINVTIPDPASAASCVFAVMGNTVQTPNFTLAVNP